MAADESIQSSDGFKIRRSVEWWNIVVPKPAAALIFAAPFTVSSWKIWNISAEFIDENSRHSRWTVKVVQFQPCSLLLQSMEISFERIEMLAVGTPENKNFELNADEISKCFKRRFF